MRSRLKEVWEDYENTTGKTVTYRELAEATDVSTSQIQNILKNGDVKVGTLEKIARFFGVSTRELLDD